MLLILGLNWIFIIKTSLLTRILQFNVFLDRGDGMEAETRDPRGPDQGERNSAAPPIESFLWMIFTLMALPFTLGLIIAQFV